MQLPSQSVNLSFVEYGHVDSVVNSCSEKDLYGLLMILKSFGNESPDSGHEGCMQSSGLFHAHDAMCSYRIESAISLKLQCIAGLVHVAVSA